MHQQVDDLVREYAAVEAVAEDILSDKQQVKMKSLPEPASSDIILLPLQVVDLDSKRNKSREALRHLRNHYPDVKSGGACILHILSVLEHLLIGWGLLRYPPQSQLQLRILTPILITRVGFTTTNVFVVNSQWLNYSIVNERSNHLKF